MVSAIRFGRMLLLGLLIAPTWPADQAAAQDMKAFGTQCLTWSHVFDDDLRRLYMRGLIDGMVFSGFEMEGVSVIGVSIEEAERGISWLCDDPVNISVPIPLLLKVAVMRAKGYSQGAIDSELSRAREIAR